MWQIQKPFFFEKEIGPSRTQSGPNHFSLYTLYNDTIKDMLFLCGIIICGYHFTKQEWYNIMRINIFSIK